MTKKAINKVIDIADKNFKKLSIQVSLNGLSFCIADTVSHRVLLSDSILFSEEQHPEALLKELKTLLGKHTLTGNQFDEVVVVHSNTLFSLVPKPLFNEESLSEYLKFNTKLLATDALAFDMLEGFDIVNIYVPFTNVNNYIYELFGEFIFLHNGSVLIQSLLDNYGNQGESVCYVHVGQRQMDITVLKQKSLSFYNSFPYQTKEDFAYYLLFVLEQLDLDTETTAVRFFGTIEEDDAVFQLCYSYINDLTIFAPSSPNHLNLGIPETSSIDFTVISTL
ncbi:DUF3822 family protein [Maribacter aurantiacus]|uniref:DUF3822 family protein n=1 Tax=Maribacter aurantiacus TaxID=1882343 RepID=A0A5R8M084_9FLAO|nr:DUF3822 family protein [Maribacter aurantiacus]TLF43023.1 DUF3822 family protein [Maribacter aurantiacus]